MDTTKYPWENDPAGLPLLDSEAKLLAYASAIIHIPAKLENIDYSPRDLHTVSLHYRKEDDFGFDELMEAVFSNASENKDADNARKFAKVMQKMNPHNNIELGIVNGIAADTLVQLKSTPPENTADNSQSSIVNCQS